VHRPDSSLGMNEPTSSHTATDAEQMAALERLGAFMEPTLKLSRSYDKERVYSLAVDEETEKVKRLESEKEQYIEQGKEEM